MSTPNAPIRGQVSTDEQLILMVLAVLAGPTLIGLLVVFWRQVVAWAVRVGVLVPARAHPLLELPSAGGAGVDLPRLAIAGAVLAGVVVLSGSLARRAWLRRQMIR
ncbi:MAG: hypothetical protein LCH96_16905 [Actinobacteria bacterium]|nr:hypothetical protein [Actinomycetota bacterium]